MIQIGDTLKKLRCEQHISQEQLANMLSITRQTISKWESNISQPDLTTLVKLCQIFHVSADQLLGISSLGDSDVSGKAQERESKPMSSRYLHLSIGCLCCAVLVILFVYVLTILHPQLLIDEYGQYLHFWNIKFWITSKLYPFLCIAALGVFASVYFAYAHMTKSE